MFARRSWRRFESGRVVVALAVMLASCAAGAQAQEEDSAASEASAWQSYRVEHRGWRKEVRFEEIATGKLLTLDYKGIPWSRDSAWNLLVDREIYNKGIHRVRYRFDHPLTGRSMMLRARAVSHSVHAVPIRSEHTAPVVELFADGREEPRGVLTYDWYEPILFVGELDGRRVEIERISAPLSAERGVLKYLIFPFPLEGEFVARIDGQEVARFTQDRQRGARVGYELAFRAGENASVHEDAALLFVVFDLMRDFVRGAAN